MPRGQQPPLWFTAGQNFHFAEDSRFAGEWKVATDGYAYTVTEDEELSRELLAWHWHPASRPDTHLHVGKGHPELGVLGPKLHVPTGRVSFEEVVLFLIVELGAEPNRSDWRELLDEVLTRFKRYRRWA